MLMYYRVYDDFCKLGCIEDDLGQFVVDHLHEPINNNQNKVVTVSFSID